MNSVLLRRAASYNAASISDIVRGALRASGFDRGWFANLGHPALVVVKPNWVQESHERQPGVWESIITHPEVVVAVVGALAGAMEGRGVIAICDAPHTYATFEKILERGRLVDRLEHLRRKWPELTIESLDLRREIWIRREEVVVERRPNVEDPRGYVKVDLGNESLLYRHRGEGRFYGADYDVGIVNDHHRGETQEYLIAGTAMKCDLFVNLPKLKTHKKTGITCCLKNLVGINGDKNWLPHHTEGSPADGGDEFPDLTWREILEGGLKRRGRALASRSPRLGGWIFRKMRNAGKQVLGGSDRVIRNGNWSGNDTCWRMALDLNRALLHGNLDGSWRAAGQARPYLAIVDGIVGGEGEGPLCADPVRSGVLFAGTDPAVVDAVACRLMGFEPRDIPIVARAFDEHRWPIASQPLEGIRVDDGREGRTIPLQQVSPAVPGGFKPHFGWPDLRRKAA